MQRRSVRSKPTPYKPFETDPAAAYLYVLTNRAFSLVKIGYTERSPKERAKELSSATGVPGEFQVRRDWFVPADRVRSLEAEIHRELRRQGYHHKKEFFAVSVANAENIIERILHQHDLLDLSLEKEEQRLQTLRKYYDDKAAKARDIENTLRAAARERAIVSELYNFRIHLQLRLIKRHPFRFEILPTVSGVVAVVLMLLFGFSENMPWPLLLIVCAGGYLVGQESVLPEDSRFVERHYGRQVTEKMKIARQIMEHSASPPAEFLSSAECKSLLDGL